MKNERKKPGQQGEVFTPIVAKKQVAAVDWLLENAFSSPTWLNQSKFINSLEHAGHVDNIRGLQVRYLNTLLSPDRLTRLMENEVRNVDYNANDMVGQLQKGIWSELATGSKIDIYRRNLQKAYIDRMGFMLAEQPAPAPSAQQRQSNGTPVNLSQSDLRSIARAHLVKLSQQLKVAALKHQGDLTRFHIDDSIFRINEILNPNK